MYDNNGIFKESATNQLIELKDMRVETDGGSGTKYSHWDEDRHNEELMTGYKDTVEHILPITIKIMSLFGHRVVGSIPQKTNLDDFFDALRYMSFSRQEEVNTLNLDYYEETEILENIPHDQPL